MEPTEERPRVKCRFCDGSVTILESGRVEVHDYFDGNLCPGSRLWALRHQTNTVQGND
jgi:hypothetical protein